MLHHCSALLVLTAGSLLANQPPGMRLGDVARPLRYAVEITARPGNESFSGQVEIEIHLSAPLPTIWMHALDLDGMESTVDGATARVTPGEHQMIGFSPAAGQFAAGKHILRARYRGRISRKSSAGLFQLQDAGRWYLYTQFQPTDARRAFPCFDEPRFKAPWRVTLLVPKDQVALANSPEKARTDAGNGMVRIEYAQTRPLPSYLVAFAVGPFDLVDAGRVGQTPLRIAVPKGRAAEAEFAAQAIPEQLRLLERFFGRPHPFPKLDSVVMPLGTFAMENPGLITYSAETLLAPPKNDTILRRRLSASVIAHEMAHQWFGNLVTTAWWDDIWLNEAFATWLGQKVMGQWQPSWQVDVSDLQSSARAMEIDSLASTRKIRQAIESDSDIANAFDEITYQKGGAVIRMFERWLGEDSFRNGVRRYIAKHADTSTTARDFLTSLSEAAKKDAARPFETFLDQAGTPEAGVELQCERGRPSLTVSVRRYLPLGSTGAAAAAWMLPFCVRYEAGGREYSECSLLSDPRSVMPLSKAPACPDWVLPNAGGSGYYRVRYSEGILEKLLDRGAGKLSLAETVSLLDDVDAMVRAGSLAPARALAMVPRFAQAKERQVVSQAVKIARHAVGRAIPDALMPPAAKFIRTVFGDRARQLGWSPKENEDDDTRLLRRELVPFTASAGEEPALVAEAKSFALRWIENRRAVDADMAGGLLRVATSQGGDMQLYDKLVALARPDTDTQDRDTLLRALGAFRDPAIAARVQEFMFNGPWDIRETFFLLLILPTRDRHTATLPFEFIRQNFDRLLTLLPRDVGGDFAAYLPFGTEGYCDAGGRQTVKEFFEPRVAQLTGGTRNLAQSLERISLCIAERAQTAASVGDFLKAYE